MTDSKRTILVVDDEAGILSVLERFLSKNGYAVLLASDANAAIDIYLRQKEKIDIVLLDINLSNNSGYDLFAKMKAANAGVKVVAASGYLNPEVTDQLLAAGVKCTLQKPYALTELIKILQEVIKS